MSGIMTDDILISNKFYNKNDWKFDKFLINEKWEVSKMEIYTYFPRKQLSEILKYFQSNKFKRECIGSYNDDFWYGGEEIRKFAPIFNIILGHHESIIHRNKRLPEWSTLPKYYYYVDFAWVLNHRWTKFLVKIYRNKSGNKPFSKIEITYWRYKDNYHLFYGDWANKLKWMFEVMKKIQKKLTIFGFLEDFSGKMNIFETVSWYITTLNEQQKKKICKILK